MRMMSKSEYLTMLKETKFTGSGKLGFSDTAGYVQLLIFRG